MSTSLPPLSAAYQTCIGEAFAQCPLIIKRWCSGLTEILHDRSTSTVFNYEKRILQNAAAALKVNQMVITQGFALELTKAIALDTKAGASKKVDSGSRAFSSLRFDQLELMGEDQVQETLDGARLQQFLLLASDAALVEFSARLSTAQRFKTVQPDKNPLRPEVFSQALLKLLRRLPVDNDLRSRWLTHGAQLLGQELEGLYLMLGELLEQQGVALAPYGVVGAPEDKTRRPAKTDAGGEQVGHAGQDASRAQGGYSSQPGQSFPAGYAGQPVHPAPRDLAFDAHRSFGAEGSVRVSREQLLTLDHLHRLMAGDYDESFQRENVAAEPHGAITGQQDFLHTLPAAADALAELEEQGLTKIIAKQARPVPSLPIALLRDQLKAEARSLGQALGIEVVGLMIEKLAGDQRLLPPVRKLIADVEPAFLRLGMTDPRLFTDKNHPARLLLEAITASSLAYPSEDAPGFERFLRDLQEVTAVLNEGCLSDAQDFAVLLTDFEGKQTRHTREISDVQTLAVQALLRAEQRNLLAEKIALEIRSRPDFISGNRVIASFLTGPWAHVMAHERLFGEHGGIGSAKAVYSLTLGDLLWSLNVLQASRHRRRLIKIIPGLLNSIREGLLSIDFPLDESKAFYDELMATHQLVIKSAIDKPEGPHAYDAREKAFDSSDEVSDSKPWLAPNEARQSGFMDEWAAVTLNFESTLPYQQGEASSEQDRPNNIRSGESPESSSGATVELLLGAWVELLLDGRWLRAQLTWISPHNTLFMFTSDGGRSHSMTAHMLQQLITAGLMKVISDQGLLEGALDSVARTAMRNSVDFRNDT